jgi:hypothetical protein
MTEGEGKKVSLIECPMVDAYAAHLHSGGSKNGHDQNSVLFFDFLRITRALVSAPFRGTSFAESLGIGRHMEVIALN